jgi:cytochrome b subunit of formate dehydrogenase
MAPRQAAYRVLFALLTAGGLLALAVTAARAQQGGIIDPDASVVNEQKLLQESDREKLVFWLALAAGAAVAISGYLLMFPFYGTNILGMQAAQVVHSIIAMLFIALIIGHIYIGTLGTEGAFEAMGTGSVDFNWAKEHHALWLKDEIAKGHVPNRPPRASASPAE